MDARVKRARWANFLADADGGGFLRVALCGLRLSNE